MKDVRRHAPDILKKLSGVFQGLGMSPFLVSGTLLGHIRDKGIIRGDYDIDIALLDGDAGKAEDFKREIIRNGFRLHRDHVYQGRLRDLGERFLMSFFYAGARARIDVYFYYRVNDMIAHVQDRRFDYLRAGQEIRSPADFDGRCLGFACVYPAEALAPLKKDVFLGSDFCVPADPERCLELTYGDWRTPKKPKQSIVRNMAAVSYDERGEKFVFQPLAPLNGPGPE